jgi:hypothetical protein
MADEDQQRALLGHEADGVLESTSAAMSQLFREHNRMTAADGGNH